MTEFIRTLDRLKEHLHNQFIIRAESSATALGMANTKGLPLRVYSVIEVHFPNVETKVVESLEDYIQNSVGLLDGVLCTSPEMTIIEMLEEDADPQTITEAMCYYYFSIHDESWGSLPKLAKEHGVFEEFNSYTEDAINHASF